MSEAWTHQPVLVAEVLDMLAIAPGTTVVDATVGQGGHAVAILERQAGHGRLLGCDLDPDAIAMTAARTAADADRVSLHHASFTALPELVAAEAPDGVDAILVDLGVSRDQLTSERFTFRDDAPLDMRLDPRGTFSATDLLATYTAEQLEALLREAADERFARRIANGIVEARRHGPLRTAGQLVEIVRRAYPASQRHGRTHLATRTWQALRWGVNRMGEAIDRLLQDAPALLRPGGRIGVISFHSVEDRKVKLAWRAHAAGQRYELVTRKPVTASEDEVAANVGARSAKLRVLARRPAATAGEES